MAPSVEAALRWAQAKSPGRTLGGIAHSIALHFGVAALALSLALQKMDGIPSGARESMEVEVELISADAFDSAFSESGAAAPPQSDSSSDDASALSEISLPAPISPLADAELMPLPDLTPIPDPVETLARAIQGSAAFPIPPSAAPPEPSPSLTKPVPAFPKAKAVGRIEKVEPSGKRNPPTNPAPRHANARKPQKGPSETGSGSDAAFSLSAVRGPKGQSGTAGTGAFASFRSRVIAHLARYKRYPDAARVQQMRGRVLVTFSLDAGGRVTGVSLASPSRHPLLNAEALAMVRRASPFPPIPPEAGQSSASFTAPIVYDMN